MAVWKTARRIALYHNTYGSADKADAQQIGLKAYITKAKLDPSILKEQVASKYFAKEVGKKLISLIIKPEGEINLSLSLTDVGMDSLVGIELCNWWKQVFGFRIRVLEMLGWGLWRRWGNMEHAIEGILKTVMGKMA